MFLTKQLKKKIKNNIFLQLKIISCLFYCLCFYGLFLLRHCWKSFPTETADRLFKVRNLFSMWVATLSTDSRKTCFVTIPQEWGVDFSQVILI